ncbi:MAG: crossover junction endodeoxyribonuclease RuvC [Chloroflexi bacterium]|jgi:crossover junction endodeoxyribonuclease RuvC|nr:crossover junction endodeoxyribonuclease RuvC [Chloroflexota bacterium]MBT7081366.1 crossover junction endodeoxyribonuclease RuvC [Chloroflexota bacterium]MBT7290674.1 crossover junction endodeoxyribonuclease RuvC [Chloroflexota bacterium]
MLILGIDPGLALMGYGLIETDGDDLTAIDYGVISTPAGQPTPDRLKTIYTELMAIIKRYQPDEVAIENFIAKNLRTALLVGQARGVAVLAAAQNNLPVYDYTPLMVKQTVAGYGKSSKMQIQQMVKLQLNLESIPRPDDAADALAIAICHIQHSGTARLIAESEEGA